MGGGLGGGSTDAAAVLLAVPVLTGRQVAVDKLFEIAASLGSDVPFFSDGRDRAGSGPGDGDVSACISGAKRVCS